MCFMRCGSSSLKPAVSSGSEPARLRGGRRGKRGAGRGRSWKAWLLLWGKGRGIYGEGFGYPADGARVDIDRPPTLYPPDRVVIDSGVSRQFSLGQEPLFSSGPDFSSVYPHDGEHPTPPIVFRQFIDDFRQNIDKNESIMYDYRCRIK
jgi:hypothetical protein